MTDLVMEYEKTVEKLKKCPRFNEGGPGAETRHMEAYQRLVRAGIKRQLRGRYRGAAQAKKVSRGARSR